MLLLLAAVTMLSALTAGQCTTPAADPLSTSDSTSCSTLLSCQRAACSCVGASPGTFPGCLVGAPAATSACSNCVATYFSCLVFSSKPSATPSNVTTDPACTTFNSRVYLALLASAATSSSSFNDTSLRQSCGYQSCLMANQAANATACAGTNDIDVAACTYNNLVGSTTSAPTTTSVAPAPSTASPNAVPTGVDVVFVLRLSGSSWATLLADTTTNANVVNALKTDIAKALSINYKFVAITSLTVGSLVVTSQIYSGTGKSTGTLVSSINTGLTFFSSLQAVYATVSAETIVTLGIAITATTAPTSAPPAASGTPAPGTPSPPGPKTSINSAASSGSALLIAFVAASIAYMTTALL